MAKRTGEFQYPPGTFERRKRQVAGLLWTIHLDGPFTHPQGLATARLHAALTRRGISIPAAILVKLIKDFAEKGGDYPYIYLERDIRGKRTYEIRSTVVDPYAVPFPRSPFNLRTETEFVPGVTPPAKKELDAGEPDDGDVEELPETFARQRLLEGLDAAQPEAEPDAEPDAEPEPDVEPEMDIEPEPVVEPESLVPAVASTNGARLVTEERAYDVDDDLPLHGDVPADLFPNGERGPRHTSGLITDAISLLTEAIVADADERARQANGAADHINRVIDTRFAAYVTLQDELDKVKGHRDRLVRANEQLIALARSQKAALEKQARELSRLQGAPTGAN